MLPERKKNSAFYLKPCTKFSPGSWYIDRAVGSNTLRNTIKELAKKAGLPDFYSNCSLCSTCTTTLYQNDVNEQLIQEITGHHSLAVHSYKRTSDNQRKMASNCIFSSDRHLPAQ